MAQVLPLNKGIPRCTDCNMPIALARPGWFREVRGWREYRGTNKLHLERGTGKLLCKPCLQLRVKAGGEQLALFDDDE